MKRIRRSRNLRLESLEQRHLLSVDGLQAGTEFFDPSPLEQEMLEHLNRMRMTPQAELDILFLDAGMTTPRDPDARIAVTYYQDPSPTEIAEDWAALSSTQPLAWNASLYDAAFDHTNLMVQYNTQSHLLPGESSVAQRLATAGYEGSAVGENIFAHMNNVFHGHSAFSIDWGVPDRGHRDNMTAATFREVGISIVASDTANDEDTGTGVGPLLVTQDYGDGRYLEDSYLLGVVWDDLNENGWYDAGEGLSGVDLHIEGTGGTYSASSLTAGGYQSFVSPGLYTVTAYGGQLTSPMVVHDVLIGDENVKVDFEYDPNQGAPLVDLNGPAEGGVEFQSTFYEGSPAVPVVSLDATLTDEDDENLASLTATITNMFDPGEYLAVDTTGTPISADYDVPSGTLTLTGQASVAEYQQVLATLSYGNLATGPDETPRVIEVEASDGVHLSAPAKATVYVVRTTLPELTIDDVQGQEFLAGSTTFQFTVHMSDTMIRTVTVDFATEDDSAKAGEDYTASQQTIQFAPGETVQTVSITLLDDEMPEEMESFIGRLSNSAGATIADEAGTFKIIDDDAPTKLGGIDFLAMRGIDLTSQSPLYQLTTTREGLLSAEVTADSESELSLVLYDQYQSPEAVMVAVSTDGVARFDLSGVSVDETYYLEVTGDSTDADLLLGNVVQQIGAGLTVAGTSENDIFEFEAGDTLQFTFNGLSYSYPWDDAESITFHGGEGDDQASLIGSAGNDTAQLFPGIGYLSGESYAVTLMDTEAVQVAGGGGNDTAKLYDSSGDDTFVAVGDTASLSGEEFAHSVTTFSTILGYATSGGEDSAQLTGPEAYNEFIGKPAISKVVSAEQYIRVKQFDHVTVIGSGGDDFARIYGDKGVEHFVGKPNFGELVGDGFHYRVEDYLSVHGYSRGTDDDTAILSDSPGDDTLVVSPVYAKIYGDGFLTRAKFFPNVEIASTGEGTDSARLYDSEGDDSAVLDVTESSMTGPGYARQIRGFDQVAAYSREGGQDTAWIYDTPGDDTFVAEVGEARLDGDGFLARAFGFGEVLAYSGAGGTDTATLFDTTGADEFHSDQAVSSITGPGYYARAKRFDSVQAYSTTGGHDTARFYAGTYDTTFVGGPAFSTMEDVETHRRADAFEAVYAEAGTADDTAIFQGSTRDDDLFESGDDWNRLSNDELGFLIEAKAFEFLTSPFDDETTDP